MTIGEVLHSMLVIMVECFQHADDANFRVRGVAWKCRNVVARDRLKVYRVWEAA